MDRHDRAPDSRVIYLQVHLRNSDFINDENKIATEINSNMSDSIAGVKSGNAVTALGVKVIYPGHGSSFSMDQI